MTLSPKKRAPKSIYSVLEKDHKETFQKISQFYEVLRKLRYEGKLNFGLNLKETQELVIYFHRELTEHMREEEKTLFPFLTRHIPRLESMIYLLLSEHQDFRDRLKSFRASLSVLKKKGAGDIHAIVRVYEEGMYLICLLRGHMGVESKSLYRISDAQLRVEEKRELLRKVEKYRINNNGELEIRGKINAWFLKGQGKPLRLES